VILLILAHNTRVILRLTLFIGLLTSLSISLLTVSLQAAPSTRPNNAKALRELKSDASFQAGAKAMADKLPDLAIRQFRSTLTNEKLSANTRTFVTIALTEALIRSSITPQGSDEQATEALQLLESKEVKDHSSAPIWKAEALAALGHYQDAEAALSTIKENNPRYRETQLARTRILIALHRTEHALKLLTELSQTTTKASSYTQNSAQLLAAEIQINDGKFDEARLWLEKMDSQNPAITQLREYLKARLALTENKTADAISPDAISLFQSLVTEPDNLSKPIYSACILGLADAFTANKQTDEAIATLEDYITKHPNSAILLPVFQRLDHLLQPDLPADHASMQKLISWSGQSTPAENALYIVGDRSDAIRTYQPAPSEHDNLVALSLYLRSKLLARSKDADKNQQALALLTRLRSLHPAHTLPPTELYLQLASASLIETAEIQLKRKQPQLAAFTLASLEKVAFSPILKDQASFLLGLLLSKETKYEEALASFNFARESSEQEIATAADINTGIAALLSSKLDVFDQILKSTSQSSVRAALELERALWKCQNNDISGRADLETFIMSHLGHSRENEARMALAAACVDIMPADIILSNAQLDMISPRLPDASSQYGISRIRIRAKELTQDWSDAAEVAETFMRDFPDSHHIPSVMLKQGQAYYNNEDFNQARRIFQTINDRFPDSPFSPVASFYTAMAARLGGTTQAREESVGLFQKIIDTKQPLAEEARIQQSRVLIDLRRYPEAEASLKPLLSPQKTSKKISTAQHHDAGILMADSYHRQATDNPKKYAPAKFEQAIAIYDNLLAVEDLPLAKSNHIHYLRGQTLESMNHRAEALDSYYNIIAQSNAPAGNEAHEIEWFWFYRCGFKALSMLEEDKRWDAAVKLARRIASFNGPRAEEASKRANNLAKQHMIWEDEKNPTPPAEQPSN